VPIPQSPSLQISTFGLPDPARTIAGSRHGIPNNPGANGRRSARSVHPSNPNKLWCTNGRHWVHKNIFGSMSTCNACRERNRQRIAHQRQLQLQAIAEHQLAAQVALPVSSQQLSPEAEPHSPLPINPLMESAISPEDTVLLNNYRNKLLNIKMEKCNGCHEEWFDLGVKNGLCKVCQKSDKYQASNNMDPGPNPPAHLPKLTQIEEMIIAPVHALLQVWQVRGGQTKYTGHTCNFPRETAVFHSKVPLLPEQCDVIIMRHTGLDNQNEEQIFQDFRVRRHAVQQWLEYLEANHPTFQSQRVRVDYTLLNQLPENGLVHNRMRNIDHQGLDDPFLNQGPPEESGDNTAQSHGSLFSGGFVPNTTSRNTELNQLHAAALGNDQPIILTMPNIRGTPINEHSGHQIAIDAFPTLFYNGKADFNASRAQNVKMQEWAAHLIRLEGGRFAQHPRFRYWALNTVMRHTAKTTARWYLNTHQNDRALTVQNIKEMLESGEARQLVNRISHSGEKLPGSKPFWLNAQHQLIAQIRSPDCGSPHVFFTASSADIQWPDMHQHMPNHISGVQEDATSYRRRMEDLNNNPAIASFYFQKRWEIFFEEVLKLKFKVKDYWWRYEWQHRGSSHVHGFLWLEDAPSIDTLDTNDPVSLQSFITFWDKHVSTWHPAKDCPPAAIHPSAQEFATLADTKKDLAEMLNRVQRHTKCAPGYCERKKKGTEEIFCRFGFPKSCRDATVLEREEGKAFAELHTKRNDEILNAYNPAFILGWRANIDFRPVINRDAVLAYIAKYASKGETTSSSYEDTLQKAVKHLQDSDSAGIAYQKMLSTFAAERDISSQEVCHILLQRPLVVSSRLYRTLCVAPDTLSEAVDFERHTKEQFSILEHYMKRSKEGDIANVTLWEFAQNWETKGGRYYKQGSRGAKPYIVNIWPRYYPDPDVSDIYEKYCYARMILHHPFHDLKELLENCADWTGTYQIKCLDLGHEHGNDTLPTLNEVEIQDDESDSESVYGDEENDDRYVADWMREAGRQPNQSIQLNMDDLGKRDMDLEYDWLANIPSQDIITQASKWLGDKTKESSNDDMQSLPPVDWRQLKDEQRKVFLQVMAYFKKLHMSNDINPSSPPLQINVDGTAGTGKSFLIWAISSALRELYADESENKDPVIRLAPTGVSAFGIHGWTIHFGLAIPVKEGKEFGQLGQTSLNRHQTRWKDAKLLIVDEKSMVGSAQMGRMDRRLRQAYPHNADEIFGGIPTILFGDFGQLPPVGDSPVYSYKPSHRRAALTAEGHNAFLSFNKSITLSTIYRQAGQDEEQIAFREALLRLRTYSTNDQDYALFSTRFWNNLSTEEHISYNNILHLLPTRASVFELNKRHLAGSAKPVIICKAKHNHPEAKKASDEDAEGLEKEIFLAEDAKVMLTRNLWTSKGDLNPVLFFL
jgi:ATP-dependent DNA helicase PIF1